MDFNPMIATPTLGIAFQSPDDNFIEQFKEYNAELQNQVDQFNKPYYLPVLRVAKLLLTTKSSGSPSDDIAMDHLNITENPIRQTVESIFIDINRFCNTYNIENNDFDVIRALRNDSEYVKEVYLGKMHHYKVPWQDQSLYICVQLEKEKFAHVVYSFHHSTLGFEYFPARPLDKWAKERGAKFLAKIV